jgi:hypothetical protein
MTTRKTVETVREYDDKGNLIKETVTETTYDDNTRYVPYYPYSPSLPTYSWNHGSITCGGSDGYQGGGSGGNGSVYVNLDGHPLSAATTKAF